jgi:glycosyltransferase involved in cell wall biosynthesis
MPTGKKTLVYFGFSILEDILAKGNVWYVRNYEEYFDEVYVVYLSGREKKTVQQGHTFLISLGRNNSAMINLLLAPARLLMFCRQVRPNAFLTADLIFSWWTALGIKIFLQARTVLMPVCMPSNLYRVSRRTVTGLPKNLERIMTNLCFRAANRVLTSYSFGNLVPWLSADKLAGRKLKVVENTVEALPSPEFFTQLERYKNITRHTFDPLAVQLLYVGRLSEEKMVGDLVNLVKILLTMLPGNRFRLKIIGDGPQAEQLKSLARDLGVAQAIEFTGAINNEELAGHYFSADIFVSPLTGSSLREAALCGLPVVAYDCDWISGFLKHRDTAIMVPLKDIKAMAAEIINLVDDQALRLGLIERSVRQAERLWTKKGIKESLARAFDRL